MMFTHMQCQPDDESLRVNLDNLLIQLRPQVSSKWYQFGEAVKIDKNVLDNYSRHCKQDDCLIETMDYWLKHCEEQPTWKDVAEILKVIDLPQLAQDIERVYTTGKDCICHCVYTNTI